jgi:hypothetical protein
MTDEPARIPPVEIIPSVTGGISAIASAGAPFIYFDSANFYGLINGVGQVTLEASRLMAAGPDGRIAIDRVVVAHLKCSLTAIKGLRAALDGIILMAEPKPEGPAN